MRERVRVTQRVRDTDRHTDSQIHRHTQIHRHSGRERGKQRQGHIQWQIHGIERAREMNRQIATEKRVSGGRDRPIYRQ